MRYIIIPADPEVLPAASRATARKLSRFKLDACLSGLSDLVQIAALPPFKYIFIAGSFHFFLRGIKCGLSHGRFWG